MANKKHKNTKNSKKKAATTKKAKSGAANFFLKDLTAERHYLRLRAKAARLSEEERYEEALEILEGLRDRYSDRQELFELLGLTYLRLQEFAPARDALEQVLGLSPDPASFSPSLRFHLVNAYLATRFPLLAYEQAQLLDCQQLNRDTDFGFSAQDCSKLLASIEQLIREMAATRGQALQAFLPFGLLMERGHRALEQVASQTALAYFQEAASLEPAALEPHQSMVQAYAQLSQIGPMLKEADRVLDKLAGVDLDTLSEVITTLVLNHQPERASPYITQLNQLPRPQPPSELIRLAATWSYLQEDGKVYELVQPLMEDTTLLEQLEEEEEEEALTLAVVAAANLGKIDQAKSWLAQGEHLVNYNPLLERVWSALENQEHGPEQGDRFPYRSPIVYLASALLDNPAILEQVAKSDQTSDEEGVNEEEVAQYQEFMTKHSKLYVGLLTYQCWLSADTQEIGEALAELYHLPGSAGIEAVKRLAFSQVGDGTQHVVAVATLMREQIIPKQAPVTIWLKGQPVSGTLEELSILVTQG